MHCSSPEIPAAQPGQELRQQPDMPNPVNSTSPPQASLPPSCVSFQQEPGNSSLSHDQQLPIQPQQPQSSAAAVERSPAGGSGTGNRLFDREPDNRHAEPLLLAHLAAAQVEELLQQKCQTQHLQQRAAAWLRNIAAVSCPSLIDIMETHIVATCMAATRCLCHLRQLCSPMAHNFSTSITMVKFWYIVCNYTSNVKICRQ